MSSIISVIIPVYNAENTICRAVDSVLNQTLTDVEVIIVNDGSVDDTEQKCMCYQKNNRVRYFKQGNSGPSSARNYGLRMAEGEYIAFLDADDAFCPEMLEKMVCAAENENAEIVICDIEIIEYDDKVRYYTDMQAGGTYKGNEIIENLLPGFLAKVDDSGRIRNHDWAVLRRIFHREFLQHNKIEFNEALKNSEDCLFTYMATVFATSICYLKGCNYYRNYRNKQSLSHQCVFDYWHQRCKLIEEIARLNNCLHISVPCENWSMFIFMCALASCDNLSFGLKSESKLKCIRLYKEILEDIILSEACKAIDPNRLNSYLRKLFMMCSQKKTMDLFLYYMDVTQGSRICHLLRRIKKKLIQLISALPRKPMK